MRAVLLFPAFENLGVEYLSAALKRAGHEVKFLLDPLLFDDVVLPHPQLAKLFSFREEIGRKMAELDPQIVLMPVATNYYPWAVEMSRLARKMVPGAKIVWGGIHVTSVPEVVIKLDFVDYAVQGEGEEAIVELFDYIESGRTDCRVQNVWFKRGSEIISNGVRPFAVPDSLPFPDKEMFRQFGPDHRLGYTIIASRGCVYNCNFCHHNIEHKLYPSKGYVRYRSPEHVIRELEYAKTLPGVNFIRFFDDDFLYDVPWLQAFMPMYTQKIGIPYSIIVHPRSVTEKAMAIVQGTGCVQMNIGFQSASARLRKSVLTRPEKNDDAARAIRLTKAAGIRCIMDNILGVPGSTDEDHRTAFEFYYENTPDRLFMPYLQFFPRLDVIEMGLKYGKFDEVMVKEMEEHPYTRTLVAMDERVHDPETTKFQALMVTMLYSRRLANALYRTDLYRKIPAMSGFLLNVLCYLRTSSDFELIEVRNRVRYRHYAMQKLLGADLYAHVQ